MRTLITLICIAVTSACSQLKLYEAEKFYIAGDVKTAENIWTSLSHSGNTEAQNKLGFLYTGGWGIKQNHKLGISFYRRSAETGYVDSQHDLGRLYLEGRVVEKNVSLAIKWLTRAADGGYAMAIIDLADLYLSGEHLKQDVEKGNYWVRRASKKNDPGIMSMLGSMYGRDSFHPAIDYKKALYWFKRALDAGNYGVTPRLGDIFLKGLGVPINPDEAIRYYNIGIASGKYFLTHLHTDIGKIHLKGKGVRIDYAEAQRQFILAAKSEYPDSQAMYYLARMHVLGQGTPKSLAKSLTWFERAAENGHARAKLALAKMYQRG
ncbi:MAG: sel1 repeat family protein, partial [Rhodospirillaceae bacterium]|nr:sel1 repeat family protein [Rhodospirillaceae bacterium]